MFIDDDNDDSDDDMMIVIFFLSLVGVPSALHAVPAVFHSGSMVS